MHLNIRLYVVHSALRPAAFDQRLRMSPAKDHANMLEGEKASKFEASYTQLRSVPGLICGATLPHVSWISRSTHQLSTLLLIPELGRYGGITCYSNRRPRALQ